VSRRQFDRPSNWAGSGLRLSRRRSWCRDAAYGRTTIDGEKGPQPANVRLGLTAALSVSRHQSIKLYGSTGIDNRTANDFWAVGIAWQYRWGGGL
jgi:hypothetical protein